MILLKRSLAIVCTLLVTAPVQAWNGTGHMVVAYVAYKKLKGPTRSRVDKLLKLNPRYATWTAGVSNSRKGLAAFLNAAVWPDCIKRASECPGYHADGTDGGETPPNTPDASQNIGYTDMAMHKYWHYVDRPFSPAGLPVSEANVPNAETQLQILIAALAGTPSDDIKSYDIAWIEHLTGDIHQPLHATARFTAVSPNGDRGGNEVKFCTSPCFDNLHSYWDNLMGTSILLVDIQRIGNSLLRKRKPAGAEGAVPVWVGESTALARTDVYAAPISVEDNPAAPVSARPDAGYESHAKALADSQVLLAGYRLAAVLNANLH